MVAWHHFTATRGATYHLLVAGQRSALAVHVVVRDARNRIVCGANYRIANF